MEKTKFQMRLALLNEARDKIASMRSKNVFTLDVGAMDVLIRISEEYQNLLTENMSLQKENKLLRVFGLKKKKKPDK
tara:strand:+ start:1680 stop:1910 length:231 start_codon:yes stop_codon:yes gene_type:complete